MTLCMIQMEFSCSLSPVVFGIPSPPSAWGLGAGNESIGPGSWCCLMSTQQPLDHFSHSLTWITMYSVWLSSATGPYQAICH